MVNILINIYISSWLYKPGQDRLSCRPGPAPGAPDTRRKHTEFGASGGHGAALYEFPGESPWGNPQQSGAIFWEVSRSFTVKFLRCQSGAQKKSILTLR
jgi:hypothetical protein